MKKIFFGFSALSLLFLSGCGVQNQDTQTIPTETTGTVAATETATSFTETYQDPDGFSLSYNKDWTINAETTATLQDHGNGKTITLTKNGYITHIIVYQTQQDCGHIVLSGLDLNQFQNININGVPMMREKEPTEGYETNEVFMDLYNRELGTSCVVKDAKMAQIQYILPISLANFSAGQYDQAIVAEMDAIISSLKW